MERSSDVQIDKSKASTWVYPLNVPRRQYQVEIAQTALFDNTLVCLPTGLGKTLIAAVVMWNYYNWFPAGKIVFMAPTKPLVDQQREACLYKVSIKQSDTVEMTGRQKPEMRKALWQEKRVFFCTPQIFEKDLLKGVVSPRAFVCVVVDECHKSTGNYATVKAVQFLKSQGAQFRVLGLSATPGRTQKTIQEMIHNLMIKTVEFRDESDPEICEHTHDKAVETMTVHPQPEMSACYRLLHSVLEGVVQPLLQANVLNVGSVEGVTRYGLLTAMQQFKFRSKQFRNGSRLMGIFLATLGENLDCGLRLALDYSQSSLQAKPVLREIMNRYPAFSQLTVRLQELIEGNYEHPRLQKLLQVLNEHFAEAPGRSRVIVFTSLRDTVFDIVQSLQRHQHPSITARSFIGQGSGVGAGKQKMTQNEQKQILNEFREGKFNVLVATCIAEEGLDIPEVQLIVCFDGAASPLRDIQRMGRTGRHAEGRVIYLLAEGKARRKFDRNNNETEYIKNLLRRFMFHFDMSDESPRMLPANVCPEMVMLHMETVHPKDLEKGPKKRAAASSKKKIPKQARLEAFVGTGTQGKRLSEESIKSAVGAEDTEPQCHPSHTAITTEIRRASAEMRQTQESDPEIKPIEEEPSSHSVPQLQNAEPPKGEPREKTASEWVVKKVQPMNKRSFLASLTLPAPKAVGISADVPSTRATQPPQTSFSDDRKNLSPPGKAYVPRPRKMLRKG